MTSQAVAASLNANEPPIKALQLLEQGRNVISSFLLNMRTDISELKQLYPSLADEFEFLRDQMDTTPGDNITFKTNGENVNHRYGNKRRFKSIVERIRAQHGFENFLLPPSSGNILSVSVRGPVVVVNVTIYQCDAFIVEPDQVRVVEF